MYKHCGLSYIQINIIVFNGDGVGYDLVAETILIWYYRNSTLYEFTFGEF